MEKVGEHNPVADFADCDSAGTQAVLIQLGDQCVPYVPDRSWPSMVFIDLFGRIMVRGTSGAIWYAKIKGIKQAPKILTGGVNPAMVIVKNPDIHLKVHWFCKPGEAHIPRDACAYMKRVNHTGIGLPSQELILDNNFNDHISHRSVICVVLSQSVMCLLILSEKPGKAHVPFFHEGFLVQDMIRWDTPYYRFNALMEVSLQHFMVASVQSF